MMLPRNTSTTTMAENIDVCHVLNSVRGTSVVVDIANEQHTDDRIGSVGVLSWFDVESFEGDEHLDISCLEVPSGSMRITPSKYQKAKSILSDYDIIHTHRNHSGFYAKLIAKRLGIPIIVTHHNNHVGFTLKGRIANGVTNIFAEEVVCVSESVYDSFARWEQLLTRDHKVSIIHNGVDIDRLHEAKSLGWSIHDVVDIDPDAVIVGSAGMLTEQKAHEVLIEAVDRANEESDRPIELVISGDGELREELERQISNATYSDRLHLLGFLDERDQVYKMMHEIDIYAMPSLWEGFCVAALEAMAIGNACVFSDIPEFRRPFEDIAYFHEFDNCSELSRQIRVLSDDIEKKEQLGKNAKEHISREYTIEATARKYLQLYEKIR